MRILHLEASQGWGGQEIRILREAEGMRERGHEVFLGIMKGGKLIKKAKEAGFLVFELNLKKGGWPLCLLRLLWILRKNKLDLINTHSSLDAWIGGIAAKIAKVPVIRTRHLSTAIKKGWNSKMVYGRLADFVVTTCSSILPMISTQSGKPTSLCRSVPTGVDPRRIAFDPNEAKEFREKLGVKNSDFLVGTACVMRSWKGIDDLLHAADQLRHLSDLRWVVIGGGHAERHIQKSKELKLEGIVHFTGHLENPFPGIGAMDVFALLSTANEGVSQAILQAAYLSKPLIATPVGGLHEVCIQGNTGIEVAPHSPSDVAKAVLELKEQHLLRKEFARNARKLVEDRFTLTRTLDDMEEIYQMVVSPR